MPTNPLDLVAQLRFMVVDDDTALRKIVIHELRNIGVMKLTEANDGDTAWNLLERAFKAGSPIDIIISDWRMPGLTGLALLKKVRANPMYQNLGFMLVTSENDANQVREAITVGVDNYLVKPVKTQQFQEKLLTVYAKKFAKKA